MKIFAITVLALTMGPVFGQTPAVTKPSAPAKEELQNTEKMALTSVYNQYQAVLKMLSDVNVDVAKNHPGYRLDPQNPFSGNLVAVPAVPTPHSGPEPVKPSAGSITHTPIPSAPKPIAEKK